MPIHILLVSFFMLANPVVSSSAVSVATKIEYSPAPEPIASRKLGNKHQIVYPNYGTGPTPSTTPEAAKKEAVTSTKEYVSEKEMVLLRNPHRHHPSINKSIAGGGVILGALATTFLVAVFCYIRATAKHKSESTTTV